MEGPTVSRQTSEPFNEVPQWVIEPESEVTPPPEAMSISPSGAEALASVSPVWLPDRLKVIPVSSLPSDFGFPLVLNNSTVTVLALVIMVAVPSAPVKVIVSARAVEAARNNAEAVKAAAVRIDAESFIVIR